LSVAQDKIKLVLTVLLKARGHAQFPAETGNNMDLYSRDAMLLPHRAAFGVKKPWL